MVGWIRFYSAKPPAFITAQRRNTMNFIVKKLELSRFVHIELLLKLLHVLIKVTVSTILSVFLNRNFSPKLEQMWVTIHLKQPNTPKSGFHEIFRGKRVRNYGCFESFPFRQNFVIFVRQILWFRWTNRHWTSGVNVHNKKSNRFVPF